MSMDVRAPAAALAPGLLLALALYAGEAAAQNACRGGAHTGSTSISCTEGAGSSADVLVDPGSVNIPRIHVDHRGSGDITVRMKAGALTGSGGSSILAERRGSGDASIEVSGGSLANDVFITTGNTATGDLSIGMSGGSLSGRLNINRNGGRGNGRITVSGDATIRQTQTGQFGVGVVSNGLGDELSVHMKGGSVEVTGASSAGFFLRSSNNNAAEAAAMNVVIEGGSVRTRGSGSSGVWFAGIRGSRGASFRMEGGSIVTEADNSRGVYFALGRFGTAQTASFRMTGGSIVSEGLGSHGLSALAVDLGSVDAMTDAGATIATPFAVGMEGRLTQDASATGRLVFAHGGAVEARDVGVLAWARRSSGHTMGAGATTADDAARTAPMIHVTSSGDVTVGAPVTDDFIRARIAGADETLSAAEQAVLSAITEGDSDALTTALAALPDDDYDAAWKAEAEDLRRKRAASSAAPTGNGPLAHRAAEEILGLSRAGVRAYALSHTAIVDHVRAGDALSDAERAVLDAVLTKGAGSELEAALTALTGATYTTAWKDTVRRFAATYNAGDIQVDVTGGAIDAEGNGVEALYAVRHDSNGAIAVSVAKGASVAGGAHGLHVRGAGAGTESLRAQSVTVDGAVTGGTGAGVHMAGGGRLTVGKTGRIGATSGVGVLSDGAGDLHATVAGTVEGDVQARGAGALTLNVMEGGVVTGTVHDPAGPLTVAGSIGRLLYTSGGTVTVAATGALTGVEVDGGTEALRSESGDLSLTVADGGMVEGDVQARGGTLKLSVPAGSEVTGTVRDPASPLTVVGSIGRLYYTNGGTVTVAATGALTGVKVNGRTEALRSESGDLSLTVADKGMVTGDVLGLGDGDHTVTVAHGGTVEGIIHLAASTVRVDGTVDGYVRLGRGGTVTVGAGGKIEGAGVRSDTGTLDVTVAGTVNGDIDAGGDLDLTIRQAPDEHPEKMTARVPGQITSNGDRKVTIVTADGRMLDVGARGTSGAAPMGAYDVGLERDQLVPDYAPRSRVYEALPSVLLGLNGTSGFHDRMAAPRSPNGVWARIEASGGSHETERSTSTLGAGLSWAERRYGAETGVDFPLEGGVVGLSAHHRRASAEVSGNDGRIDVAGEGLGASMAWRLSDDMYVAGEVSATRYDVALKSGRRGSLRSGVGAFGHAVGVEAGRRVDLGSGPLGVLTATPRARLSYSRVGMDGFTDAVDASVSLDKGRAATGVAGVAVEASEGGSRVFGSVDVEHAFSRETVVEVSEEALSSQTEATRARFEVGGSVEWGGGRYALQGAARWATGARDYGGGMVFKVRF